MMCDSTLTAEQMGALAEPFSPDAIQWKPGATNGDKSRCLALAYVDLRHYIDRLNEVAGVDWSDDYEVQEGGKVVVCRLTIGGVTRADVGEAPANDENTATVALAQAFKRACVKFGLGAHLYRMPSKWVPYDAQRKRITEEGLRMLGQSATFTPQKSQQATPRPKANGSASSGGNGDCRVAASRSRDGAPRNTAAMSPPTSPQALLEAVNRETGQYYNHLRHLFQTLRIELGEAWSWPAANDVAAWRAAGNAGVAHVRKAS